MSIKLNGVKPSPHDLAYNRFESAKAGLVKLADTSSDSYILTESTPISNQGVLGTCVANATCDALEILLGLEGRGVVQLSRLFTYWNARVYTQDTDKDEGTFIHNAFDSLQRLGVCPEADWPYDTRMVFTQPSIRCYKTANDNTISSYYRIDSYGSQRLDDVESAIRANHPVVFATGVSDEYTKAFGVNKVWDAPTSIVGNHAMIITGVRRTPELQFRIRNSWGDSWGINGHTWFSADYIMSSKTFDLWVPTRVDDLVL